MGIFDAMNTSVGGLQAQSFALQNISGNIANSSTTGYKGIGTSFVDLIPDASVPSKQVAGGVTANAKATITTQGTISSSSVATNMAITGDGFFSIQKATSIVDNLPQFSGVTYYTRRGDFQLNANGNLVNGAGYYLMGVTVDPKTGNPTGNVASVLKFQNNFIPAQATTSIQYAANLPSQPNTAASSTAASKTLLAAGGLNPSDFAANPLPVGTPPPPYVNATISGAAATGNLRSAYTSTTVTGSVALLNSASAAASSSTSLDPSSSPHLAASLAGQTLSINNGSGVYTITFDNTISGITTTATSTTIGLKSPTTNTVNDILNAIATAGGAGNGVSAVVNTSGNIQITGGVNVDLTISGTAATTLGLSNVTRGGNVLSTPPITGNTLLSGAATAGGPEVLSSGFTAGPPTADTITVNGQTLTFVSTAPPIANPNQISTSDTISTLLQKIDFLSGASGSSISNGVITLNTGTASPALQVSSNNTAALAALGFTSAINKPRGGGGTAGTGTVIGNDVATFTKESISGGAVTAYNAAGTPVNLQLRWAKTDSASLGTGHTDSWNLFYQTDPSATGTAVGWVNTGQTFTFAADGSLTSPSGSGVTINNVSVSGQQLGSVAFNISSGGLTQYASTSGAVTINTITQNGYAAGQLRSVAVNNSGLVVGTFSNGQNLDLAQVTLSHFNGTNYLKAMDGGAYSATDQSGPAIDGASGSISGSSLEGSNTDIADEFTKLIVTQQAYSANTKVITTANSMVQDLLNVLR
ncbi:flagellar hook-basal body complex protein [Bradyrhizobium guangdongense]